MQAKIETLKAKNSNNEEYLVYPRTLIKCVTNEHGENLEEKINDSFLASEGRVFVDYGDRESTDNYVPIDADTLEGHSADYFATAEALNTAISSKANVSDLAKVATSGKYSDLSGVPSSLPASDVYSWAKAASKPSYTKAEVGLGNVDNTADSAKSVKYATSAGSATSATTAGTCTGNAATASILKPTESSSTISCAAGSWAPPPVSVNGGKIVWRESFKDSSLGADSGDVVYWLSAGQNGNAVQMNVNTDGDFYAQLDKLVLHTGNVSSYAITPSGKATISASECIQDLRSSSSNAWTYYTCGGVFKASAGYYNAFAAIANEVCGGRIGVNDSNVPQYRTAANGGSTYTLLHTGNTGSAATKDIVTTTADPGAGTASSYKEGSIICVYE